MNNTDTNTTNNKPLAVFGATRGIGRRLTEQALAAGHRVTVLVRDPTKFDLEHDNLAVVEGNVLDPDAVRLTIRGADSVIVALGAKALSRSRIRSEGTQVVVDAMKEAGVRRLLCVSVMGAGDSMEGLPWHLRYLLFPLYLRQPLIDHEAQEAIVKGSGLDWTLVRPPFLTDGPATGEYEHGFVQNRPGLSLDISRADVADFMLRHVDSVAYLGRTPGISYAA